MRYAICHGNAHRKKYKKTKTVDANSNTYPDILGSILQKKTQAKLGDNIDQLRFVYCLVDVYTHEKFPGLLQRLKIGGKAIIPLGDDPHSYVDIQFIRFGGCVTKPSFFLKNCFTSNRQDGCLIRSKKLLKLLLSVWKEKYDLHFSVRYWKRGHWVTITRKK